MMKIQLSPFLGQLENAAQDAQKGGQQGRSE